MLQPDAIVQQVWQGRVPADWEILHGSRRSAFAVGGAVAAWTFTLGVFLSIAAFIISIFIHASQTGGPSPSMIDVFNLGSLTIAGYPTLVVVAGAALVVALLVGIIAGIITARRNAGDPDPVIVLLPNGFVEYVSQRKPIISIPFAEIADVDLRVKTNTYRSTSTNPTTGFSTTNTYTRTNIWLDLQYRNGRKERWEPRANFGRRLDVCQTILKAHARFMASYGRGR